MHILEYYYEKIIKRDLVNKFNYLNIENVPKLKKIVLNFGCKNHDLKSIASAVLSLELISDKRSKITKTKAANIFLKIKKGAPIGCCVVLEKKYMYKFLFKLLVEIFPELKDFKGLTFNNKNDKINNFSFYINDLVTLKELNNNFYLFNNLPSLNVTLVLNTKTKLELLFLLKSFKIPIIDK